jgi:hypothetical protein
VRAVSLNLPPMPGGPGQIPALNTGTGDRAAIRSLPKRQLEKTA